MKISLIGMSGTGKSYWSKKLEKEGFIRFGCDDLIENKLEEQLKVLGFNGINDVAKWMGQPFDNQYPATSKKYLSFEKEVMETILKTIESIEYNVVIDTTGSVIYTGEDIINKLKKQTKIIYLDTPFEVQQKMFALYIQDPKPVIWGDIFEKHDNQTNKQSLQSCYPKLLESRSKQYALLADNILHYHRLRESGYTIDNFIDAIL